MRNPWRVMPLSADTREDDNFLTIRLISVTSTLNFDFMALKNDDFTVISRIDLASHNLEAAILEVENLLAWLDNLSMVS